MATPAHRDIDSLLNKLRYYSDASLHLSVITNMTVVALHRRKGYHSAIPESLVPRHGATDPVQLTRLRRYCGLWLSIRKHMGFHDNCYFRSAVICRSLRCAGIDARLNFGTMKGEDVGEGDWHFTGHCWVSCGIENIETAYPFVIQYPSEGTA